MERRETQVKQIMYEGFPEHSQIDIGTVTQWENEEGCNIDIQRKHMPSIQISLTHDDISLFRKMFSDMDY
jgi:hypothetical protein